MTSPTTDRRFGLVGNIPLKAPVAAVATSNLTLSGEQTIDGVAVLASNAAAVPDRVLVVGQADAAENGIYDVSTGAWTRARDANGNYDVGRGTTVCVTQGTLYGGSYWRLATADPITIGTTQMAWAIAAGLLPTNLTVITTIAALKAQSAPIVSSVFVVLGYAAAADGGGGIYWWDSTSVTADNGGTVLQLNSGGNGRFIKIL